MIDRQVELVRGYAGTIAILGESTKGRAKAIEADRARNDHSFGRDTADAHLGARILVIASVIISTTAMAVGFVGSILLALAFVGFFVILATGTVFALSRL
ncbi:hypothetical protein [Gordonia oryzae]|uniref:hypothetical protein n=1 Tax=Gordonia oryzae TaxID=2487349 RepID=UPI0026802188